MNPYENLNPNKARLLHAGLLHRRVRGSYYFGGDGMRLIEFFFGKWSCTDICLVGINGLLMVFRHSVTGRQIARIEVGNIRREVSMTEAREIIDSYAKRYQGWV